VALSPAACRTPTSLSLDCFLGSGHMPPSSERALRKASELCRDVRYCLLMLMHWQHSCPLAPSPIEWGRPHGHVMLIKNLGPRRGRMELAWRRGECSTCDVRLGWDFSALRIRLFSTVVRAEHRSLPGGKRGGRRGRREVEALSAQSSHSTVC
jgi:hypothetical protein